MNGTGQWPLERVLFALAGACPASVVLRRVYRLRSAIYENGGGSPLNPEAVEIR